GIVSPRDAHGVAAAHNRNLVRGLVVRLLRPRSRGVHHDGAALCATRAVWRSRSRLGTPPCRLRPTDPKHHMSCAPQPVPRKARIRYTAHWSKRLTAGRTARWNEDLRAA